MSTSIRGHNLKAAAMWGSGGRAYDEISRNMAGAIDHTVTRLNPVRGERVADVATGTGWTSRMVARCGADVVGVDIAEGMLVAAREIAQEQNLTINYKLGDAEALPFGDGAFDAVISTFGVMFAPDQLRVAAELARVCRQGGRVAVAAWTPDSHAVTLRAVLQPFMASPSTPPPPSPFVGDTRVDCEHPRTRLPARLRRNDRFASSLAPVLPTPRFTTLPFRSDTEVEWLRNRYRAGATLACTCTGAVMLAQTGLLDGMDATIHWNYAPSLAKHYPRLKVDPDKALVVTGAEAEIRDGRRRNKPSRSHTLPDRAFCGPQRSPGGRKGLPDYVA